jgi:benzoyl-CoA reductase subunit C
MEMKEVCMTALEELKALPRRKDNTYIADWKSKGGHIIGYTCHYAPAEIMHAAGIFPYRMEARGCTETGLADIYFHRFNCTYARCILQEGLSGGYDFLDGLCFLNGCEQIRRMFEVWDKHIPATDYQYMVTLPHSIYDEGFDWYREDLYRFSEDIRRDFTPRFSDIELRKSIEVYNESKRLVHELYELRKGEEVPISGSDSLKIILAAGLMPRDRYNELLKEGLDEIKKQKRISGYKARIMVGGSELDNPQLFDIIEDLGAVVVTDTLCSGSRSFQDLVEIPLNGNPLDAIAHSYYYSNPCPRMMGQFERRLAYTEKTAKEANVDGIILQKIVFCDNHAVDSTMLADELEPKGIPVLTLDRDHMLSDVGRLKTRIEAFIERVSRR